MDCVASVQVVGVIAALARVTAASAVVRCWVVGSPAEPVSGEVGRTLLPPGGERCVELALVGEGPCTVSDVAPDGSPFSHVVASGPDGAAGRSPRAGGAGRVA